MFVFLLIASSIRGRAADMTIQDFMDLLPNAWNSAPTSFSTAYSPCLDAIVVNYRAAGCNLIAQDPEKLGAGSVGLICVQPQVSNGYTQNEHVVFHTLVHDVQDFEGWDVFCVDPHITVYIPEPSNTKWRSSVRAPRER